MRIIAGSLKGRRLKTPPEGGLAIRPTSDKAREALFSILQRWAQGPFLDLFGGTGAVGLEAFSRGYGPVVILEQATIALNLAKANSAGTPVEVRRGNALGLSAESFRAVAVVFADPPYAESGACWARLSPQVPAWLAPGGVLVWECGDRNAPEAPPGLRLADSRRYGAACFHFYEAG